MNFDLVAGDKRRDVTAEERRPVITKVLVVVDLPLLPGDGRETPNALTVAGELSLHTPLELPHLLVPVRRDLGAWRDV